MPEPRILIIGGSTRAAADSVRRAGGKPICADLFADLDLRRTAEVIPVRNYPASLPDDVRQVAADGWFYCGALENHPSIIERMLNENPNCGPLLGTTPQALKLVRRPDWWTHALVSAGLPSLDVLSQTSPPKADGSWLQKPLAGAGGREIRVWDQACAEVPLEEPHYFQRRVSGQGVSFLFHVTPHEIACLGASSEIDSHQLSRAPTSFSYCGSFGPLVSGEATMRVGSDNSATHLNQARMIAETVLCSAPGVHGLVGFDFRLCDNELWLTEINPRYTASVEVLELATGTSLLKSLGRVRDYSQTVISTQLVAKQILYASRSFKSPDLSSLWKGDDLWVIPYAVDIPIPGTLVEAGWPICTVMASGSDPESLHEQLANRIAHVESLISSAGHQ